MVFRFGLNILQKEPPGAKISMAIIMGIKFLRLHQNSNQLAVPLEVTTQRGCCAATLKQSKFC
jgi:hypothetical protein